MNASFLRREVPIFHIMWGRMSGISEDRGGEEGGGERRQEARFELCGA